MRPVRFLPGPDPVLKSAARDVIRLWKPMAAWSLTVWALVVIFLSPLSSLLLGWSWLTRREEVVGNEALLGWILTPQGTAWLVLAGSLALAGTVLHFAGIFEIVTEDREGTEASVPETALRLAPRVPALARLCAVTVLAGLSAASVLAAGLWLVHRLFLGSLDINYYLAVRPTTWWYALAAGAIWLAVWALVAGWLLGRSLLALPAYLDGHRPLTAAVRRSWRGTRGEGFRVLKALAVAAAAWFLVRATVDAGLLALGRPFLDWTMASFDSLHPILAAIGGWVVLTLALDAAIAFLGIAFVSTLLTGLYHEDSELPAALEPAGSRELSPSVRSRLAVWSRPTRVLPALGLALLVSLAVGAVLLERIPDPRSVAITAHRAGPPPAPENTLAALERSVAAGADWAEIDVQLTRDGVPVVVHDADLMRVAGDPRRVSQATYRELSGLVLGRAGEASVRERRIANLTEFLDRADGRIGLMVELKYYGWDARLAQTVVRVLREARPGSVMLVSLDLRAVRQLRELGAQVPVGYAAAASVGDPSRLPVDFLALSQQAARPSRLRSARRRGVDVHVWTVNRAAGMARVIQAGADGIITDRPGLAVRVDRELQELPAVARLALRFGHLVAEEEGGEVDDEAL